MTFLGGILTDYISSSLLFPLGLLLCGISTFLFPFGSSTGYFSFVWFLNGIGHGLSLPTALRITKQISGDASFATNWSFVLIANNIAGVLNPLIHSSLATFLGWRMAVFVCAGITFVTGITVLFYLNQNPTKFQWTKPSIKQTDKKHYSASQILSSIVLLVLVNRFGG